MIDLSIIIVNWRSVDFLRRCLKSVYLHTNADALKFEIVVLDNASFDGCAQMIEAEFPQVRFHQVQTNLGFASANNIGFGLSTGRNVLFLNPDTEVHPGGIAKLVAFLDATADAGIVGPTLLNSDGSVQTSCIQSYPTLLNQAFDADYLRRVFPKSTLWGNRPLFDPAAGLVTADVISGACLLIRREVFDKVQLFSSNYFMYAEDVDLCYKVKCAGWGVYYLRDAVVTHHGGQSSHRKPESNFATVMTRESLYNFMLLRRGRLYAAAFRSIMAVIAALRLVLLGGVFILTLGRFKRAMLSSALRKWTGILRWSLGMEGWVKELVHSAAE